MNSSHWEILSDTIRGMQFVLDARVFRYLAILFFVLFLMPVFASAAELTWSPTTATVSIDQTVTVKITVDPQGEKVNAADGTATFDKDLLSVVSVTKDGSAFSLWTAEPSFSNSAGTIIFSGGTPSGFSNAGTVVSVTFKGKAKGEAKLAFSKGSILAADGKGTDVYKGSKEATITVSEATAIQVPETVDVGGAGESTGLEGSGVTLPAPIVNSSTHPKPENWYSTSTAAFTWKLLPDVLSVRILVDTIEGSTPKQVLPGIATSTRLTGIPDGVNYFHVQFRNDSGWGEITHRLLQIDTVPPLEFDFALLDGDVPKFSVKVTDELSGVERYEILLGATSVASLLSKDVTDDTLPVPPQPGGMTKVTIKVYDKAGNFRLKEKDLELPLVKKPTKAGAEPELPPQPTFTWERILLILFAIAIGALATIHYNRQKMATSEKLRILDDVAFVRDKNDKIFSAMREEFEQMVNDFDIKPQLTAEERELLENIKEVLEVSEELVDSSMEELKKNLHDAKIG